MKKKHVAKDFTMLPSSGTPKPKVAPKVHKVTPKKTINASIKKHQETLKGLKVGSKFKPPGSALHHKVVGEDETHWIVKPGQTAHQKAGGAQGHAMQKTNMHHNASGTYRLRKHK